jgi:hypothetical protein
MRRESRSLRHKANARSNDISSKTESVLTVFESARTLHVEMRLQLFIKSKSRSLCVCSADGQQLAGKHAHQTIDLNLLRRVRSTGRVIYLEIIIHDRATICVCTVHFMIISFLESSARKSLTCILKCRLQMYFVMKSASKHWRVLIGYLIQFLRLSHFVRNSKQNSIS